MVSVPAWPPPGVVASSRPVGPRAVLASAPDESRVPARRPLGFPRRYRLLKARDFERVFARPSRSADPLLTVIARSNTVGHPRLGLAISRKVAPRAHQRNRIKRLVRESFRVHAPELAPLDFVVMARSAARDSDNRAITASLERHWRRLVDRCADS